ncbi:PAS domain S-box protein [Candidatus Nitrospira bockiana]
MSATLALLLVEDSEDDARLTVRELERRGYQVQWLRVDSAAAMREALDRESWDAVLADYSMAQFTALDALAVLRASGKDLPFIVVSEAIGEDLAAEAMRAGAHDYVMKGRLSRLGPALEREIREARGRQERRRTEAAWHDSETRLRAMIETAHDAVVGMDECGRITVWNRQAERMFGWARDEVVGKLVAETIIPRQYRHLHTAGLDWFLATGTGPIFDRRLQLTALRRDGSEFPIELSCHPFTVADTHEFCAFVTDITHRKLVEEELRATDLAMRELLEERQQLSENLHDGIVQSLYAVGLLLHQSRRVLASRPDQTETLISETIVHVNGMIEELRRYIQGDPGRIRGVDFVDKVKRMGAALTAAQPVSLFFDLDADAARLLTEQEAYHLYYLLQEAISNSIRHSKGRHCRVRFQRVGQEVWLDVSDDGIGFEPDRIVRGKGLSNLESRARQIHAVLTVEAKPGEGTRILVKIVNKGSA